VHGVLCLIFIIQGFIYDTPIGIINGLINIILGPDILVTDYIYTGGLGAALVNVGLAGLITIAAFVFSKHIPSGLTMGTLGLVTGFAFFGKNPLNMLPIMLGGYLYSKFVKKPYGEVLLPSILATCLAPAVTQLSVLPYMPTWLGLSLGVLTGVFIGFVINPLAVAMRKAHDGYNLYNVGFVAGMLGLCLFALYQLMGIEFVVLGNWSYGYNRELTIFLAILSVYLILCGFLCKSENNEKITLRNLIFMDAEGYDYFKEYQEKAYINMGLLGLACLLFMFVVRGEYSGPVIGAILSVVGFGAFGKALQSATPIVGGAMLAATVSMIITSTPFNDRSFLVAALFSTCLSPLAKKFGIKWGLVAGFLHLTLATNITIFHGGMNLYNNGFAGGLTAMVLLPIILFLKEK